MTQNKFKMKEEWTVLHGEHNHTPIIIRLNTGCKEIMGSENYSFRMGIALPFLKPQTDGFPSKEEKINLDLIENEIFEIFQENDFSIISAIITTNNMIEFMIYISDEKSAEGRINMIGSKHPSYKFQCYIVEDKDWNGYKDFLINK